MPTSLRFAVLCSRLCALALLTILPLAQAADRPPQAVEKCTRCHGLDGASGDPAAPRIAGLQPAYIVRQIQEFADGRRKNDDMATLAGELDAAQIQALATWYGARPPAPGKTGEATLAAAGKAIYEDGNGQAAVQACATCHQADGAGNQRFPRLAGQRRDYIARQLADFKSGRRTTDAQMSAVARGLSPQEIRALAEHIGGL